MSKEIRPFRRKPLKEAARTGLVILEALELPHSPCHKRVVHVAKHGSECRGRKPPVVCDPPPKKWIEQFGDISHRPLRLTPDVQLSDCRPHGLHGRGAHSRVEPTEQGVIPETPHQTRPEAVPEEVELDIRILIPAFVVAAIDNPGLGRMQFQAARSQASLKCCLEGKRFVLTYSQQRTFKIGEADVDGTDSVLLSALASAICDGRHRERMLGVRVPYMAEQDRAPLSTDVSPQRRASDGSVQPQAAADERLRVGERLSGRYRIERELAEGGMGVVYLAKDEQVAGETFAIKVLKEGLHPEALTLLREEVHKTRRLSHPNIVDVHSVNVDGTKLYVLMEYLEGKSLNALLDEEFGRGMPLSRAWPIIEDVGAALGYAHDHSVIHSDLKPANVFVTTSGRTKLLDFGIARVSRGPLLHKRSGPLALTPAYASCEMLKGEEADRRDDIYSFACVIYEMLSGERPFGELNALEAREAGSQVPPLEMLTRGQNAALAKALAFDREGRTSSVEKFLEGLAADKRPRARPIAVLGGAIIAALAVLGLTYLVLDKLWPELLLGSSDPAHTIAVLPLQNLSGDASQEYFADGITDALTTHLARMESLQVISRTSTMQYKSARKLLPAIARELKADVIVEGSVQRSGNRVRITAQLVRAATDKHLWAQTYERDLKDILALQDEIASGIANEIEMRLGGPTPLSPGRTVNVRLDAYEAYLKANYYADKFELQKSIDYYDEAIKLDPTYAPAYAHMAQAYSFLAFFGALAPREGWGKVKEAATLAVEKDEHSPEGHAALALAKLHFDWDFAGAEEEFNRTLKLNPSDADTHHEYAHYLMAIGRTAESEAESKRAVELDPMGDGLKSCLCWHSFAARDYDEAVRLARRFLASQPNDPWEHTILGWTYEQKRMLEQAIVEFQSAIEATKGDSFFLAPLGHAYALAGRRTDAEQVLHTLLARAKKSYVSPFDISLIYTALGEKDSAFAWLEQAANERSTFLVYSKWDPRLDPLRSDPRFKKLLDLIGLPA
jgi:serine/threonine protein kinase/Flp pilus assembly protein TadD